MLQGTFKGNRKLKKIKVGANKLERKEIDFPGYTLFFNEDKLIIILYLKVNNVIELNIFLY